MSQLSKVLRNTTDNGLMFKCPGCNIVHHIRYGNGDGTRWDWNGDINTPTFSPSILVRYPTWIPPVTPENMNVGPQTKVDVVCHSFITNGQIQFLNDCTHLLAGQTVDMIEWGND